MSNHLNYKLHDKITYKGVSGTITSIYRYTDDELLEIIKFPDLDWVKSQPFLYTMTYDIPQSYESIILRKKFPENPSKWNRMRETTSFDYDNFANVKLL
jgi:hypothetical protein